MREFRSGDMAELVAWYNAHEKPAPEWLSLPATGLIEPGVAAGFLYRTDSSVVLIEGFVTNPFAPTRARAKALDGIAWELLALAKGSLAVAICKTPGMARRAARHGLGLVGNYALLAGEV